LKALVTGGAGFIGSSLCEALVADGWDVTALDNMSVGTKKNLASVKNSHHFNLIIDDCTRTDRIKRAAKDCDVLFHFAANPEVRMEFNDPSQCFQQNIYATYAALEALAESRAKTIVFASTSAVYGEATIRPTPEHYSPLVPISIYAGSKLAGEAMISSYCHTFNKQGIVLRFANILGPRSTHGVVVDFVTRLRKNPSELQMLGDGKQTKSYLHIDDCVSSILTSLRASREPFEAYNVGSEDQISVTEIAKVTVETMALTSVRFSFAGGLSDGRGWVGDVRNMLLDINKLKARGWTPRHDSRESVKLTVEGLASMPHERVS
jgi:UDP-glucose 4-epimerase